MDDGSLSSSHQALSSEYLPQNMIYYGSATTGDYQTEEFRYAHGLEMGFESEKNPSSDQHLSQIQPDPSSGYETPYENRSSLSGSVWHYAQTSGNDFEKANEIMATSTSSVPLNSHIKQEQEQEQELTHCTTEERWNTFYEADAHTSKSYEDVNTWVGNPTPVSPLS